MFGKYARVFFSIILIVLIACTVAAAKSPDFPKKPVRFIVPYPAGSGNDIQTRGLAPYLEKYLGGTVTIENRPGADGRLGLNEAWKSAPDGYTIINAGMPTPIINEKLFSGSVNYKTREFTHIYAWSQDNVGLFVNAEKWKTAKEFLAEARARSMAGGISGIGSVSHIAGLSLAGATAIKPVNWVPFKGGAETVTSLAGKHIDFGVTTTSSAKPLVDAGKLRVVMIFSDEKDPVFPSAPLPQDAIGLDLEALPIVRGALAPPGMSPQIAADLRDAFARAAKDPEFLAWAKKVRVEIQTMDHEKFLKYTIGVEKEVMKYLDKIEVKN